MIMVCWFWATFGNLILMSINKLLYQKATGQKRDQLHVLHPPGGAWSSRMARIEGQITVHDHPAERAQSTARMALSPTRMARIKGHDLSDHPAETYRALLQPSITCILFKSTDKLHVLIQSCSVQFPVTISNCNSNTRLK